MTLGDVMWLDRRHDITVRVCVDSEIETHILSPSPLSQGHSHTHPPNLSPQLCSNTKTHPNLSASLLVNEFGPPPLPHLSVL